MAYVYSDLRHNRLHRLYVWVLQEVNAAVVLYLLPQAQAGPGRREVYALAVEFDYRRAQYFLRCGVHHLLDHLHHIVVVGEGFVALHRGELRVVRQVQPLVAEYLADFIHALQAAHD